jgi:hypothetical protein
VSTVFRFVFSFPNFSLSNFSPTYSDLFPVHQVSDRPIYISLSVGDFKTPEPKKVNLQHSIIDIPLESEGGESKKKKTLTVQAEIRRSEYGVLSLVVYCKYWIMNCTGLSLKLRQKLLAPDALPTEDSVFDTIALSTDYLFNFLANNQQVTEAPTSILDSHLENIDTVTPAMFSFDTNDVFGSKCTIKVENSKWSKSISLESVGTGGDVDLSCMESNRAYSLGIINSLVLS